MIPPYNPMDPYHRPQQMTQTLQSLQTSPQAHAHTTSTMQTPNVHALPNLRTLQAPLAVDKLEPVSPVYHSPSGVMSATMSVNSDGSGQNYALPKFAAQGLPPMAAAAGQKRSFSSTFDTQHVNTRLQQGARPQASGQSYSYDGCESPDMEEPMDRAAMSYRRADGTQRQRHVPAVGV